MTSVSNEDVAERFFDAMSAGDRDTVAELFAEGIAVWHSSDPADQDKRTALRVIDWFLAATETREYRVTARHHFDGGFVQQHTLAGTARSGDAYSLAVAIIVAVDASGHISRIDEYLDPADLSPLLP